MMVFRNVNLDENIMLKNKIPLLIEEKDWLNMAEDMNNRIINSIRDELAQLVQKQRDLDRKEIDLQKEKTLSMKMILGVSDAIHNKKKMDSVELLDEYKNNIEEINEELEEIEYQLEILPRQIRELNFNLLKATVYYGFRELRAREKKLKIVDDELEGMRDRIKELINEKYDYEEWIDLSYSFLHGLLGSKEIERLDEKMLK